MHKYKISIEYFGPDFSGWQKQKNASSVQGCLEEALFKMSGCQAVVHGSGRTDAGVHALEQIAHFEINKKLDINRVQHGINYYLKPKRASIFNVEYLGEESDFHARYKAINRAYIYKIIVSDHPLSIYKDLAWWIKKPLDVEGMKKASQFLIGTHDFSAFRANGCQAKSPVKTINSIEIKEEKNNITIEVQAPSFLYNQVRNIVGTLYYVGCGKYDFNYVQDILQSNDRKKAGVTAPAHGLYFKKANY